MPDSQLIPARDDQKILLQAERMSLACAVVGLALACIPLATEPFNWPSFGSLALATGAFGPQMVFWLIRLRDRWFLDTVVKRLAVATTMMLLVGATVLCVMLIVGRLWATFLSPIVAV